MIASQNGDDEIRRKCAELNRFPRRPVQNWKNAGVWFQRAQNFFRKPGFIDYSSLIRVHKLLPKVILLDHLPDEDAITGDLPTSPA